MSPDEGARTHDRVREGDGRRRSEDEEGNEGEVNDTPADSPGASLSLHSHVWSWPPTTGSGGGVVTPFLRAARRGDGSGGEEW